MAPRQTTKVSNAKLKLIIKLGETFCIKAENGEWDVPPGTYKNILGAVDHFKTEMFKQDRQRRRTMNIEYVEDVERRPQIASENTKNVIEMAYHDDD